MGKLPLRHVFSVQEHLPSQITVNFDNIYTMSEWSGLLNIIRALPRHIQCVFTREVRKATAKVS